MTTINDDLDELREILERLKLGGYYSNQDQADDAAHALLIIDEVLSSAFRKLDCHLEDARDLLGAIRIPEKPRPMQEHPTGILSIEREP